ncbi:MAG: 2,3-bisphosphoglycerate-independent phosphoglycerate mutase [bacterium]|nr:2,3-bisphosphoglycerate-independent phosphoglycerate mutase [bacterium]
MKYSCPKPLVLIVMDGWGLAPPGPGNAVTLAKTPNLTRYWSFFPHTELAASGVEVGLPRGEDGNSEVGHINLGAGRIVHQDLPRINMEIADGNFFKNPAFLAAAKHVRRFNSRLHLMGLVGAGGVHSSLDHLLALLQFAKREGLSRVFLHLFTDGRDSPPTSSPLYLQQIADECQKLGVGEIATISGRYFAMDRDFRWERTRKAYEAIVKGIGEKATSAQEAIQKAYEKKRTDEFVLPTVIYKGANPVGLVSASDSVIFFNFRIDRPRQLTEAFVFPDFETRVRKKLSFDPYAEKYYKKTYAPSPGEKIQTFPRGPQIENLFFVTMTEYETDLPVKAAYPPISINMPLARILSDRGLRQLHLAETEKERFVTYYFNGQRETNFPGEEWAEIPSPKEVPTYDLKPEMSAPAVRDYLLQKIKEKTTDFILVNFANPDMVGHTGVLSAGIKACEVVDGCIGQIIQSILLQGGACIITADHGNVEEMINLQTGEVDTEHSTNAVPLIYIAEEFKGRSGELPTGVLADVAPTILSILGVSKPSEMTGRNLLIKY